MIVKNGEIIAIGKVKHDDTLSGTGISDDKLGLSQKVRDAIGNKQNKLTPAHLIYPYIIHTFPLYCAKAMGRPRTLTL